MRCSTNMATRPSWPLRLFLMGYVVLSFVCVGLTGSRSAFLGLVLCAVVTVFRSRWRWALWLGGALFAVLLANYWIADEIYPYVPAH